MPKSMPMRTVKPKSYSETYPMPMKAEQKHYPEMSLDITTLPEIKDWKVGKSYKVTMEVEQISMNLDKSGHGSARFAIKKIGTDDAEEADEKPVKIKKTVKVQRYD